MVLVRYHHGVPAATSPILLYFGHARRGILPAAVRQQACHMRASAEQTGLANGFANSRPGRARMSLDRRTG